MRYILITDDEYLKQVMPDNVLIISEQFLTKNITFSLEEIKPNERNKIELWLLQNVMHVPSVEDIIVVSGDVLFINGVKTTPQELVQLRSEVQVIKRMKLWKILNATLGDMAKDRMTSQAHSFEDMRFGKMMLYTLDVQNNILSLIQKETLDEKMKKVVQLNRNPK